jgi:outer membrane cobalamin receptor
MKKIVVLFCIFVSFVSVKAMAEDAAPVALLDLDAVVVTASKYEKLLKDVPHSVTVIDEKDIEKASAVTVADVLKDVVGLQVKPQGATGALASVSMRGMKSAQVLVLIDGRPVNKFQDGEVDFSKIPVNNIASIEVVRGATSSLYGSNAMGGVINIITKKETKNSVNVSYGTYNTSHSDVTVSHRKGEFVYNITAAKDSSKGDRPNSGLDSENINFYSGYKFTDEISVDLRAGYYNSRLELPGLVTFPTYDDKQFDKNNYADLEINLPLGIMLKSYTKYDTMNIEWRDFLGTKQFTEHKNRETGNELRISRDLADWNHIVIGGEYRDYKLKSSEVGSQDMQLSSAYLHDEIKFSDLAILTIGGRHDSYKDVDDEFSPSAALLVNVTKDTALRFSAGKSFRVPTFNDLYWPATVWTEGNPNLDPETGVTYDIGIDTQFKDHLWVRVTGFVSDVEDMIVWAPGLDFVWRPYNISNAKIKGLETEVKARLNKYVTANIGYTLLDSENEETGVDIIYTPTNKIDASIDVTVSDTSLTLSLEHVGKRYHNDPDASGTRNRLHEYTVYNAFLSHDVNDTTQVYVKGENIFERKYAFQKDYPMPGAAMYAGMRVNF